MNKGTELDFKLEYCYESYKSSREEEIDYNEYKLMTLNEFLYEDHDAGSFEEYVDCLVSMYKEEV